MKAYRIIAALFFAAGLSASGTESPATDGQTTVTRTTTTISPDGTTVTTTETETVTNASPEKKNKFVIAPTGRILLDGAVYISHDKEFVDGVGVPDIRAGVKMQYGMWQAKVDIGYSYNKLGLKDVFVQANFNPAMLLRVGYFIHQFGLQSATSSSMKISMEEPTSNEVFNYPRQLGAMFVYDKGQYLGTASVHTEGDAAMKNTSNVMGKMRFGFLTRQVWRPYTGQDGIMLQVGVSGAYDNPNADNILTLSGNFPTRVAKIQAIGIELPETRHIYRVTPELLAGYGPVALETQYYWLHADRRGDVNGYSAYGAYALLRGLILGGDYKYSHADGGLSTPSARSLEMVLGYNYTNLNDSKCGVRGGRINDVSATLNWYLNKYMIWRLRYSYTHTWGREGYNPENLGSFQTRFQIIF